MNTCKNIKLKLTCLVFVLISITGYSQTLECGTIASETDYLYIKDVLSTLHLKSSSNDIMYFNVQHHIIQRTNRTGGMNPSVIPQIMSFLNSVYIGANVQFESCGEINFINDDNYFTFHHADEPSLINDHNFEHAINIYYPNYIERNGVQWWGYSHFPSDNINFTVVKNTSAPNLTTVAHEFGHFFGLIHTFSKIGGTELVTRDTTNCNNRGDLLCDTPADHKINEDSVNTNCIYIGTATDATGVPFAPSVENIMAYSRHECRSEFSPLQLEIINTTANLSNRQTLINSIVIKSGYIENNISNNIIHLSNATIPSGSNIVLDACNYTLLEDEITIEKGAEIEIR